MAAFETDNVGVVVVTHGTPPPSRALDSLCFHDNLLDIPKTPNGFILLVKQATALIRALINEGKRVHVIASGGKRQWTDALAVGDVLLREIVRDLSIDLFTPSPGAHATIEVESSSKNTFEAAKYSMQKLQKRYIKYLTVVCAEDGAIDAFQLVTECPAHVIKPRYTTPDFCE